MRTYYHPFYPGVGVGVLYAYVWEALLLPKTVLAVIAVIILALSYYGYRKTQKQLE